MSLPSSPSSGSSSAVAAADSGLTLTPRSKVKALMASVDDSDSETERVIPSLEQKSHQPTSDGQSQRVSPATRLDNACDGDDEDNDEEDESPVARPKGGMAARMMASSYPNDSENSEEDAADAYHRVRQRLTASKKDNPNAIASTDTTALTQKVRKEGQPHMSFEFVDDDSSLPPSQHTESSPFARSVHSERSAPQKASSLFVSPSKPSGSTATDKPENTAQASDSDDELPTNPLKNKAFLALVNQKRKEIREQEEEEKRKRKQWEALERDLSGSEGEDNGDGERLTQQARPTRKAGKKALEELKMETQRISRNMQLAHQAKTRKTFRTADLLTKLKFCDSPADTSSDVEQPTTENSYTCALASSDAERGREYDSPFSSPLTVDTPPALDLGKSMLMKTTPVLNNPEEQVMAAEIVQDAPQEMGNSLFKGPQKETKTISLDSDDDLEVMPAVKSRFPAFDLVPVKKAQEASVYTKLRALANLNSPSRSKPKGPFMSDGQLRSALQKRARAQAKSDRQEHIEELRARGVVIETAEDRERELEENENLLDKARDEAEKLRKLERARAKKDGDASADEDDMDASDDEDEDWADSGAEGGDEELSGSDDEDEDDAELEDELAENALPNGGMLDLEADDSSEGEREALPLPLKADTAVAAVDMPRNRKKRVIADEEDEDEHVLPQVPEPSAVPKTPVRDDEFANFLGPPSSAPLGLTQMFAGTQANSGDRDMPAKHGVQSTGAPASLNFLRDVSISTPPAGVELQPDAAQTSLIFDSQISMSQHQTGMPNTPNRASSFDVAIYQTQFSQMPDPTQDAGLTLPLNDHATQVQLDSTQITVDTVPVEVPETPVAKRKGRFRRRQEPVAVFSDDENQEAPAAESSADEGVQANNAYKAMLKASRAEAAREAFDKKKSMAKDIVEEQAQESEDEYAGLGGASDDDSNGEMDHFDEEMIDDEGNFNGDERQLAAFYANKKRVDNEKEVDKLYRDITTGALRRKRGADFELSDSDDDAQERRRRKQREFARMRKALMEDEKIGKIAENPKKLAFLRAIEDRDSDGDGEFVDNDGNETTKAPSQSQAADEDTAAVNGKDGKTDSRVRGEGNQPSARHPRRTAAPLARRANTLAEIRETISFLVEDSFVQEPQGIDSDHEAESIGTESHNSPGRPLRSCSSSFINRLAQAQCASDDAPANPRRGMAFHANSAENIHNNNKGVFKTPAMLLRRATTGGSGSGGATSQGSCVTGSVTGAFKKPALKHTDSTNSAASTGSFGAGGSVRMGGSKKSNIHYQAREMERRKQVDGSGQRRRDRVQKKMAMKGREKGLGFLAGEGNGFE